MFLTSPVARYPKTPYESDQLGYVQYNPLTEQILTAISQGWSLFLNTINGTSGYGRFSTV